MKSVCYIAHINVEVAIDDPQKLVDLIEYAAKCGAIYFAVNYKIKVCEDSHLWVGSEDVCPKCGKPWKDTITRVVGFFTNVGFLAFLNKMSKYNDYVNDIV